MFSITVIYEFLRNHARAFSFIACIAGAFSVGLFLGWWHERDKLVTYKASVAQIAADQERRNAEIVRQHQEVKEKIHEDYQKQLADLRRYYDKRLREQSSSHMSSGSDATRGVNGSSGNSRSNRSATSLVEDCAEVTLQLQELQRWVRETRTE